MLDACAPSLYRQDGGPAIPLSETGGVMELKCTRCGATSILDASVTERAGQPIVCEGCGQQFRSSAPVPSLELPQYQPEVTPLEARVAPRAEPASPQPQRAPPPPASPLPKSVLPAAQNAPMVPGSALPRRSQRWRFVVALGVAGGLGALTAGAWLQIRGPKRPPSVAARADDWRRDLVAGGEDKPAEAPGIELADEVFDFAAPDLGTEVEYGLPPDIPDHVPQPPAVSDLDVPASGLPELSETGDRPLWPWEEEEPARGAERSAVARGPSAAKAEPVSLEMRGPPSGALGPPPPPMPPQLPPETPPEIPPAAPPVSTPPRASEPIGATPRARQAQPVEKRTSRAERQDNRDDEPTGSVKDKLSISDIVEGVKRNATKVMPCLRAARDQGELDSGEHKLRLAWDIRPDGTVGSPRLTGPSYVLGTSLPGCFSRGMRSWRFPPSQKGAPVKNFPFGPLRVK